MDFLKVLLHDDLMTISQKKLKCLVVDDEQDILEIMQMILSNICDEVVVFSSATEALKSTNFQDIDLIFSDISMPGMSGMEFLRSLRMHQIKVPFIFVSGFSDDQRIQEAEKLGANLYLTKPFRPQDILNAARHYLSEDRFEDERRI
jgi:CheY-like chemotaxis protein